MSFKFKIREVSGNTFLGDYVGGAFTINGYEFSASRVLEIRTESEDGEMPGYVLLEDGTCLLIRRESTFFRQKKGLSLAGFVQIETSAIGKVQITADKIRLLQRVST